LRTWHAAIGILETMWHKDVPRHPDMYMYDAYCCSARGPLTFSTDCMCRRAVMQTLDESPDLVSRESLGKLLEMIPAEEQFRKAVEEEDAEFGKPR
jgi:hypothetical protein